MTKRTDTYHRIAPRDRCARIMCSERATIIVKSGDGVIRLCPDHVDLERLPADATITEVAA